MIQSGNPVLRPEVLDSNRGATRGGEAMTIQGTVVKSFILLLCVILTAAFTWGLAFKTGNIQASQPWMLLGLFGGLIAAVVTVFKVEWSGFTAPIYALMEGLFLGGVSAIMEVQYPGIVLQAVGLTFATCAGMLFAYESGMIRATEKFKLGVFAATGGIALFYLVAMVLSFFGIPIGILTSGGFFGIAFSVFVVAIAALNLVIDFDIIEQSALRGAPKYMEWYGAFALMVTLVWLYLEILRLLAKTRSNR